MKVVISPAKKLDFETEAIVNETTCPQLMEKTHPLIKKLKTLSSDDIAKLMKLSSTLSELNYTRFQNFTKSKLIKPAAYAFNGDTYTGLDFYTFNKSQVKYAQKHLKILSGLYGILRPLDEIKPYRLEMGTRFGTEGAKNLYDYWSNDVTKILNKDLKQDEILINCASQEYFKVINQKNLKAKIITPVFKEMKNGEYKIISFNAKKARGMMANYILKNKLNKLSDILTFDHDSYQYNKKLSTEDEVVFTRG